MIPRGRPRRKVTRTRLYYLPSARIRAYLFDLSADLSTVSHTVTPGSVDFAQRQVGYQIDRLIAFGFDSTVVA